MDEVPRSKIHLHSTHEENQFGQETRSQRQSLRSNTTSAVERIPRPRRRGDIGIDEDQGRLSLSQSKSESKLRCLTNKYHHRKDIRTRKSEAFPIQKTEFIVPTDTTELDHIIKSFESIEIDAENSNKPWRTQLNLISDCADHSEQDFFIPIKDLKEFKDSCFLYKVTSIK